MRDRLQKWAPSEFLARHNPDVGLVMMRRGMTAGELAVNEAIPTLGHVAEQYGDATAVAWLRIQLDAVDVVLGANAFGELARHSAAQLILAKYRDVNVGNLLQFFTRFRCGEYNEAVEHIGGVQKIMTALRLYMITRDDDARRVVRERETERAYREREAWREKAISYEEYLAIARLDAEYDKKNNSAEDS